jgi:hypothetical protein
MYTNSTHDKEINDFFLLNQQMGPYPKLSMYSKVDLRPVLFPNQYESVYPMRSNVQPTA